MSAFPPQEPMPGIVVVPCAPQATACGSSAGEGEPLGANPEKRGSADSDASYSRRGTGRTVDGAGRWPNWGTFVSESAIAARPTGADADAALRHPAIPGVDGQTALQAAPLMPAGPAVPGASLVMPVPSGASIVAPAPSCSPFVAPSVPERYLAFNVTALEGTLPGGQFMYRSPTNQVVHITPIPIVAPAFPGGRPSPGAPGSAAGAAVPHESATAGRSRSILDMVPNAQELLDLNIVDFNRAIKKTSLTSDDIRRLRHARRLKKSRDYARAQRVRKGSKSRRADDADSDVPQQPPPPA